MAYGIYCTRLRENAVNDAVRHRRRVVTSLSQEYTTQKLGLIEFSINAILNDVVEMLAQLHHTIFAINIDFNSVDFL